MTEQNSRKTKEITISEDEYRKWSEFQLFDKTTTKEDVFATQEVPPFSTVPKFQGRVTLTHPGGKESWGPLLNIKKDDVVVIKRSGLADKRLKCLNVDESEIELQDLWQEEHAKKE